MRLPMLIAVVVAVIVTVPAARGAAEEPPQTGWRALVGTVLPEFVVRPLVLLRGIGNAHDVVTITSKAAQQLYDQGLDYLHGYVFIEAARSDHQALRLDPQIALAYLGLSRAYNGLGSPDD